MIQIKGSIYFINSLIIYILQSGRNFKLATPLSYITTYSCIHILLILLGCPYNQILLYVSVLYNMFAYEFRKSLN